MVWTEQASPRVLRVTNLVDAQGPGLEAIQLSWLAGVRIRTADYRRHVQWPSPAGTHRLVAEVQDETAGINAVILPLDEAFDTRLDAARRFWRALNGRPPVPAYGALPYQSKLRHILNLRAHDGRRANATHRHIAGVLLSNEPILSRDWRDHPLRHKVRAILRRADRLVAGGYRDLLFYPHRRGPSTAR